MIFIQSYFNYRKKCRRYYYQDPKNGLVEWCRVNTDFFLDRIRKKHNGRFTEWIISIGKTKSGRFCLRGMFFDDIWEKTHHTIFEEKFTKFKKIGIIFLVADTQAMVLLYWPLYCGKLLLMLIFSQITGSFFILSVFAGLAFMALCARPISMIIDMVHQKKKENARLL